MNALITGISGFVGSHLAEHLLAAGDRVLGATRDGAWLPHYRPQDEAAMPLVAWDLGTKPAEGALFDEIAAFAPDVVYHLAALSIPADCGHAGEPSSAAVALNIDGVGRVLDLARRLPHRPRVVFLSSSKVYGTVPQDRPVVDEDAPLNALSAYARTKLMAEHLCRNAFEHEGADVVIVRSFNQAGPRQDPRLMLAEWARRLALRPERMEVGGLNVTLDLLDVRDGVRALRKLALHGPAGSIYNLGTGTPHTTGEIFRSLERAAGTTVPVSERDPRPRSEPIADIRRLQAAVDWSPQIPLDQTTADVWAYWRDRAAAEAQRLSQEQVQQQQ